MKIQWQGTQKSTAQCDEGDKMCISGDNYGWSWTILVYFS